MKNSVTESLITELKKKKNNSASPDAGDIAFLRNYYHRLSGQDFERSEAIPFMERALTHRKLGQIRKKGQVLIQIENQVIQTSPGIEEERTIIYIIQDDRPFIINSLLMKLNHLNRTPVHVLHPLFMVRRDSKNSAESFDRVDSRKQADKNHIAESYIQFVVEAIPKSKHKNLEKELKNVIATVRTVVSDWKQMNRKIGEHAKIADQYKKGPVFAEYGNLLRWLAEDHFAFLGYCELEVNHSGSKQTVKLKPDTVLGILRASDSSSQDIVDQILPPIVFTGTAPVVFTKSRSRASIHRPNYMDCILFDHDYESKKSRQTVSCFMGFLAGSTSALPTVDIPHIGKKIGHVLEQSTLRKGGYAYKELRTILETLPRDKLFHMEIKKLYALSMTLLNQERRKTRVHLHRNVCGHFFSCLVYVPRDLFNSKLRETIMGHLAKRLNAREVEFDVYFSNSILTRIHYVIQTDPDNELQIDEQKIEAEIQEIARDWNEKLLQRLLQELEPEHARTLAERFHDGFTAAYLHEFDVDDAIKDLQIFERLDETNLIAVLDRGNRAGNAANNDKYASFKLYSLGGAIALSDAMPILENMGARVLGGRPYKIFTNDGNACRILDFNIVRQDGESFDLALHARVFQETFTQCWSGAIENDGFNQLTLLAGLEWRQIMLIRAYYRYLKQIRLRYSENYIVEALTNNPELASSISKLFALRFRPDSNKEGIRKINTAIKQQLDAVSTLDEERIIRALLDVIAATLRINYYQTDPSGQPKPYLSFKLDSGSIPRIPEPSPKFEIFVYSPRIEGVHLRGGAIARGGLRWSERPEDFRTEVLGLVKAQRVKNAVIVPVGSKGGFVAKQLPGGDRKAIQEEVVACYRTFISGLLDITDNLKGNKIIPPKDVQRMDDDDPYLVVAADKGTATFSDIANEISQRYGFWLGDAFASGGSAGYDHKKMGITARGAWESVKRHFRELGKDIQNEAFTVAGIGDMGGDVFGNGMLLSGQIKLVAAFNHMHIFIDPDPDPENSCKERKRLFETPGTTWADYDSKLISKGGGVFSRADKSIKLSAQVKKLLGAKKDSYAPDDLINLILKAEVELLWNGGIGTYVKSSKESHADAQDRNNDSLRVDGSELRCKVIGEGGNLGMTQSARIEFAQRGGLCYTDAIDNSAGVDTSDHEVNIKILLNAEVQKKRLTFEQRNKMLSKMEDDIARLVLANNYLQTQALSYEAERSDEFMSRQSRAMAILEESGLLVRQLEYLPDNATLHDRMEAGQFLCRPELAVLLSYSKIDLYQRLLETGLPDDPFLDTEIIAYFPELLAKKYSRQIKSHRLKREIIATQVTNDLVGVLGPTFHIRLADVLGVQAADVTAAYLASRTILGSTDLVRQIQDLDNKISAERQMTCHRIVTQALESAIMWITTNNPGNVDITRIVDRYSNKFQQVANNAQKIFTDQTRNRFQSTLDKLKGHGVPDKLAHRLAALQSLSGGLDIVDNALNSKQEVVLAAQIHFGVESRLGLDWLYNKLSDINADNLWHERSVTSLLSDLRNNHTRICDHILTASKKKQAADRIEDWVNAHSETVDHFLKTVNSMKRESHIDLTMLSVLVSELNRTG